MEKLYCGNCGYPNSVENKFCNNCGGKLINSDVSNIDIKSKKIKDLKSEETLQGNYQKLRQKLTLLIKTSGYFTIYCSNRYIQFLKYETEKKLHVAIIHIDNTEMEIRLKLESLKFEPLEENLIRSFDIVSTQKTIKEVIAITKKIFEGIYLINPAEPFFYEILEKEKLEKQIVDTSNKALKEKLGKQKVDNNYKRVKEKLEEEKIDNKYKAVKENTTESDKFRRTVVIIVVVIIVAFFLHYFNTSNNSDQSSLRNFHPDSINNELKSEETTGKLVGVWIDEELNSQLDNKSGEKFINSKIGYEFVISKDNKLYVQACNPEKETLSKNATTMLSPFAQELRVDKTRYTDMDKPEQYYVIDGGSNNLLIYDNFGLIVKCKNLFIDYGNK